MKRKSVGFAIIMKANLPFVGFAIRAGVANVSYGFNRNARIVGGCLWSPTTESRVLFQSVVHSSSSVIFVL